MNFAVGLMRDRLRPLMLRFENLSRRDRRALSILIAIVLPLIVLIAVWRPVETNLQRSITAYNTARSELAWMLTQKPRLRAAEPAPGKGANDQPLLIVAGDAATGLQLKLSHAEPAADGSLNVAFEDVRFGRLLLWLEAMQRDHGLQVTQFSVDRRKEPGMVSAALSLKP